MLILDYYVIKMSIESVRIKSEHYLEDRTPGSIHRASGHA